MEKYDTTITGLKISKEQAEHFLNFRGWPNPDYNYEPDLIDTLVEFAEHLEKEKAACPNFWIRLKIFLSYVQTSCAAGEDEKRILLEECERRINNNGRI